MMSAPSNCCSISPILKRFSEQLTQRRQRGLVVVSGERDWCLNQLPTAVADGLTLWLGNQARGGAVQVSQKQSGQWLGRECDTLVVDGFDGIDLNALGALSGTLKAGGLCILMCPPLNEWSQWPNPQNARFCAYPGEANDSTNRLTEHLVNVIKHRHDVLVLTECGTAQTVELDPLPAADAFCHPVYKTSQQRQAVTKIVKVVTGHRRRPLVLTADRGRGKSSALGLAVCKLMQGSKREVIISAPQVSSTQAAFDRVDEQLEVIERTATSLTTPQGSLRFVPPDELIRTRPKADLVMIDEAAAIPAPMLTEMLSHYSRLVFTSTISGYEGTGRGFEVRFKQTLDKQTPNWQAYHMAEPVRWREGCPFEAMINQALVLDSTVAAPPRPLSEFKFSLLDRDQLLKAPDQLRQIIGLLTLAHYKTTPNDLRHLLDGNNIEVFTLSCQAQLIGTVMVAVEGRLADELIQDIVAGKRRPKGHLLPQTLAYHCGYVDAGAMSYARIVRIAVHPDIHRQGLGRQMLNQLTVHYRQQDMDFVGSSFGATPALLAFWQNQQYTAVRLGLTLEATSNEYSAVVLNPLTSQATQSLQSWQARFDSELLPMLAEFYLQLPVNTLGCLLQHNNHQAELTRYDQALIDSYCDENREYEFAYMAIYRLLLASPKLLTTEALTDLQRQLLVDKILRKQTWQQVANSAGLSGKKQAAQQLKQAVALLWKRVSAAGTGERYLRHLKDD